MFDKNRDGFISTDELMIVLPSNNLDQRLLDKKGVKMIDIGGLNERSLNQERAIFWVLIIKDTMINNVKFLTICSRTLEITRNPQKRQHFLVIG